MDELFPGIFKVFPSKVTGSKYPSFLVTRSEGNLLFPCFSNSSTIHDHFDDIAGRGGLDAQLLGDSHFRTPHCDEVALHFKAPLYCSEAEAPDVVNKVRQVVVFPFRRHELFPGVEVIPTPGHRPGGVCYLLTAAGKRFLFAGDAIWHDGNAWKAFPTKAGLKSMGESLKRLEELDFDVLLANTRLDNPVCFVEVNSRSRRQFVERIAERLS
ncbi:MAG: MBL fold metallo-hydrolase [Gaiella sp.]